MRSSSAQGWRSRRALRITALAFSGVVVALVAGLLGLWWAGNGQAHPVAMHQVPSSPVPASAGGRSPSPMGDPLTSVSAGLSTARPPTPHTAVPDSTAVPTAATRPSPGATSASPTAAAATRRTPTSTAATRPSPSSATATRTVAPADWTSTITGLDRARAKALVSRDPALLDAVYTQDSAARSADAQTIRTLTADGLRVSGAEHRVQSVQPVAGATATILVRDSLPSYQVLSATGAVVGRTPQRSASPRVMVLVQTAAGYRISEVRNP